MPQSANTLFQPLYALSLCFDIAKLQTFFYITKFFTLFLKYFLLIYRILLIVNIRLLPKKNCKRGVAFFIESSLIQEVLA